MLQAVPHRRLLVPHDTANAVRCRNTWSSPSRPASLRGSTESTGSALSFSWPHFITAASLLQVLLLLLSQDVPLMQAVHRTPLAHGQATWYKEQALAAVAGSGVGGALSLASSSGRGGAGGGASSSGSGASLGSLVVAVVVRAVQLGFGPKARGGSDGSGAGSGAGSGYLPSNALAVLANMAPHVVGLHR